MISSWLPDLDQVRGPLYWRIEAALANDIRSGRLAPGDRLPTHRALAQALGVTVNTVTKAFVGAERSGLVVSRVGRGTFVKGFPEELVAGSEAARDVIDLTMNVATTDKLNPVLNRLLGALSRRGSLDALLRYHPYPGVARHRAAAARWIAQRGLEAQADKVIVCNGSQEGVIAVLAALTRPGDIVLTEQLNYGGLRYIARSLNLNLRGVETDDRGLVPEALETACRQEKVAAVVVTPTNHNPTNAIAPLERRQAWAEIAARSGTPLIEDDAFGHLTGNEVPTLTSLAPDRCIYVCGLSKCIAVGLRIGYVLAPAALVGGVVNSLRTMYSNYPALMAELATSLISEGHASEFVAWHRQEALERFKMAIEALRLHQVKPLPSYHLWLPLQDAQHGSALVSDLLANGVLVSSPEKFLVDHQHPPQGIRLSLGSVDSRDRLQEGLRRIAARLQQPPLRLHNLPAP